MDIQPLLIGAGWPQATTLPKKILILTMMKLWKMALFAQVWLKKSHHSSNSRQKPDHAIGTLELNGH
jgi:hypothetical protein